MLKKNDIFFRMEYYIHCLLKIYCFELFGDGKYGLILSQKFDGKVIFTWCFFSFFINELIKIDSCSCIILTLDEKFFKKLLLYRYGRYDSKTIKGIILASIKVSYPSKRFNGKRM